MKRLLGLILFLCFTASAFAVGCAGTGACYYKALDASENWSDVNNWWTETNGGGTNGSVPTLADNAITDAASYATAWTLTIDDIANALDVNFGNPASGVLTVGGTVALNVYGNFTKVTGALLNKIGGVFFKSTSGTKTITSNGGTLVASVVLDGIGGTFQLADDITVDGQFTLSNGTFDANTKTVVMIGPSSTLQGNFIGLSSFYNLFRISTAAKADVTLLKSNIAITNSLKVLGNSVTNRVFVTSDTIGTARTITLGAGATITADSDNFDLRDITFSSASDIDLSTKSVGGGTISGVTQTGGGTLTLPTPIDVYWYKASGNANGSDTGNHYTDLAHTTPSRYPLIQDTVKYQNGFGAAGMTLTQNMPRIGGMDWTGAGNSPTFAGSTNTEFYGSCTFISAMSMSSATNPYAYVGRGSATMTSAGLVSAKNWIVSAPGGTLTLGDAFSTTGTFIVANGTFSDGGNSFTAASYTSSANSLSTLSGISIVTGTGTVFTGAGTVTHTGTILVINTTATVKVFAGGGKTFGTVTYAPGAGIGEFQITGSNTFVTLRDYRLRG